MMRGQAAHSALSTQTTKNHPDAQIEHIAGNFNIEYPTRGGNVISEDKLIGLLTFLGGVLPLLTPIYSFEIMPSSDGINVGIRRDNDSLGYDFVVREGAMVGLCCEWKICMGDPAWSKKLSARIKKCTTQGKWGCVGCKFGEDND